MALKELETGKYYKVISVDVFTGYTIIYVYRNEEDRRNSETDPFINKLVISESLPNIRYGALTVDAITELVDERMKNYKPIPEDATMVTPYDMVPENAVCLETIVKYIAYNELKKLSTYANMEDA